MKRAIILGIFVTTFGLIFYGCATGTLSSKDKDLAAKQFSPKQDTALVYVFRKYKYGGAARLLDVHFDGRLSGEIGCGNYLMWEASPGSHKISVLFTGMGKTPFVEVETDAGKCYFFECGFWMFGIYIDQVSEEKGREAVSKYKLVEKFH